jgi:hypothetical protein
MHSVWEDFNANIISEFLPEIMMAASKPEDPAKAKKTERVLTRAISFPAFCTLTSFQ